MREVTKNMWKKTGWFFYSMTPCIAYFVLSLAGGAVGSIIFGLLGYLRGEEDIFSYIMDQMMVISIGFALVGLVVFGLWYYFGCRRPSPRMPGGFLTVRNVAGILVAALGLQFVSTGISNLSGVLFPNALESYIELMETAGISEITLATILYAVILGPIAEELTFRGLTFYIARRFTSRFWLANTIQAVMFGIMHGNLIQGIYAFFVGLALGWIYWYYHSLYASILAHIAFNLLGTVVLDMLLAKVPDTALSVTLITLLGIVICGGAWKLVSTGKKVTGAPDNIR